MNWNRTKLDYYFDFALVPVAALLALIVAGPSLPLAAAAVAGFVVWTLAEYWIHRALLHVVFRRQHWIHHRAPGSYATVPGWITALLHAATYGAARLGLGLEVGTGAWLGLEAGYLIYILTHDAIHHRLKKGRWLRRIAAAHDLHHSGRDVNFGVSPLALVWDRVFGTYENSAPKT